MKTRLDENLSFEAWQDVESKSNPTTYYFEVDENGEPIKLGDGSYGMVYRVSDRLNGATPGEYAVKIFYKETEIEERFENEYSYYEGIRKELAAIKEDARITTDFATISGLVKPERATREFHNSEVYKNYFKSKKSVKASSYAVVMKCYHGTLKDLLERKNEGSNNTGYQVLQELTHDTRFKAMYKFVLGVIQGVKYLYVGGHAHLDIKPANIFYIRDDDSFEVVLADVGYFSPKAANIHTKDTRSEKLRKQLLGTLHYRSPEQKDDYDICEAKIEINEGEKVIITDPKFKDSIIEEGDILFFSKYDSRRPCHIKGIEKSKRGEPFKVVIGFDSERKFEIDKEEKTQVTLQKNQGIRTDLFGIGAIIFDILTAGNSPERFYEKIRSYDSEENSVSDILEKYRLVASHTSDDADQKHIFNSFESNNDFPDKEIVEFILKCILYKAKGTFFDEFHKKKNMKDYKVINEVYKEFKLYFEKNYGSDMIAVNVNFNPILTQRKVDDKPIREEKELSVLLKNITDGAPEKYYDRLFQGMKIFDALVKFLGKKVFNPNKLGEDSEDQNLFLAELRPNLIFFKGEYDLRHDLIAYPTREKFIEGLEEYSAQNQLNTDTSNFFVPEEIANLRRSIRLFQRPDSYGGYSYSFLEKSFLSDDLKEEDYIIPKTEDKKLNILFKVSEVFQVKQQNRIRVVPVKEPEDGKADESGLSGDNVYFYRAIGHRYYLHMLAVYIQHLFFANLGFNSKNLPQQVFEHLYIARSENKKLTLRPPEEAERAFKTEREEEKALYGVLVTLTKIFLGLILSEKLEEQYAIRDINEINNQVTVLRNKIQDFLEIKQAEYDNAELGPAEGVRALKGKVGNISAKTRFLGKNTPPEFHLEAIIDKMLKQEIKESDSREEDYIDIMGMLRQLGEGFVQLGREIRNLISGLFSGQKREPAPESAEEQLGGAAEEAPPSQGKEEH